MSKPREFWLDLEWGDMYFSENDFQKSKQRHPEMIMCHTIEKSAYDKAVEALKYIDSESKNRLLDWKVANKTLKELGEL